MIDSRHTTGSQNSIRSVKLNSLGRNKINYWIVPGTSIAGTPIELINFVCQITGVSYEAMTSKSQKREIADARFLAMYFLYDKFIGKYSLSSIAKMFNLISHATVLNAIKVTKQLVKTDYEFRSMFEKIEAKIK